MPILEALDLHKTYPNGVDALRGVSFRVEAGEVFALLGPNGAGKSTTVRILVTLAAPTRGSARVAGFDILAEPQAARRALGYVAQVSAVDQLSTGRELLTLQGRLFGLGGAALHARVDELLTLFGLEEAAGRRVKTYSGGMLRRLDLAAGLIHRPRVVILDEPTNGLDPESRQVLRREIVRLRGEGVTFLLTTHDLEEVDRLADRLVLIDRGRIVAEGTPETLKNSLAGDRITVELTDPTRLDAAAAVLAELGALHGLVLETPCLHVQAAQGPRQVAAVVSALEGAGIEVARILLARPSLDDVYLQLTGRSFDHSPPPPPPAPTGRGGRGGRR